MLTPERRHPHPWRGEPRGERAPTLLHQGPHPEPEAVEQSEVVFYHLGAGVAGMSIIPLVRAEPAAGRGERWGGLRRVGRERGPCAALAPIYLVFCWGGREWG